MSKIRSTEIKVGVVSALAILLLILGISWGKGLGLKVAQQSIFLRFPNSGGIQVSSPVDVNGVRRGAVSSIKNDNGQVLITANIDNANDFKSDVSASITIFEITGSKKIEIFPGNASDSFNPQNEIIGKNSADIADLITFAGEMVYDTKLLMHRIDSLVANLNNVLSDENFIGNIKNTVDNTYNISNLLNNNIESNLNNLNVTLSNLKELSTNTNKAFNANEQNIQNIIDGLSKSVNQLENLLKKADNLAINADSLILNLHSISNDIQYGDGILKKVIYDKEFAKRIDSSISSINQLMEQIRKHGINTNVRLGSRP